MKAFPSIFRNGFRRLRAAGAARKRPSRSFTSTFATLEARALLSTITGPVLVTPPTLSEANQAFLESIMTPTTGGQLLGQTHATPGNGHGGAQGAGGSSGGGQGGSQGNGQGGSPGAGGSRGGDHDDSVGLDGDHVSMDVARVDVDGQETPEFALSDFSTSTVFVRLGNGPAAELGPIQGVNHPESVTLADINGDGIPDLIVANTNGDNILIFPGLGDGQFGPELNGLQGFAVGRDPVSVTVNDLQVVDGKPTEVQLIVANALSNTVSLLDGQASGGTWTPTSTSTIATTFADPTKTLLYDITGDGEPDLLVCNTGNGQISILPGLGDGSFDSVNATNIRVGADPQAMVIGTFDRHDEPDLITANAGSDDLTYVANVFGPDPVTQTISSGGTAPDAAFAVDPNHTGVMDLVVANGGDGRLAVFQGGDSGLQLAGVISPSSLPSPTAVAPGTSGGDVLDFFAATAGDDSALLLQFDLGVASTYLPNASADSGGIGQQDTDLFAQLMPFDGSSLDLIAVLWSGSPDGGAAAMSGFRDPTTLTVLYSPTEGQGGDEPGRLPQAPAEPETLPVVPANPPIDSTWARVVSGVDEALERPRRTLEALAVRDLLDEEGDRPIPVEGLVRLDLDVQRAATDQPLDADLEGAPGILGGGTIRLLGPEATPGDARRPGEASPPAYPRGEPSLDGAERLDIDGGLDSVPLVSTALLASGRLILKASPPRPPSQRGPAWLRRFVSPRHDPRTPKRPQA